MRLLFVEDYAPVRNAVAQGFRENGFAVDTAGDGAEGLWLARTNDYDVIVLDIMLPEMDGLTVLQRLRELQRPSPVLILTCKDTVEDRVKGLNAGADDYVVKPFAFPELLARVRALVRRKYDVKSPTLRVADLVIDTASRTVQRGSEAIDLTAREYGLLEFLAYRAGQLVTRTDIWEHLYNLDDQATSNVVDVYVGYLRKKIDRPNEPSLIHTRRGQGFILGAAAN